MDLSRWRSAPTMMIGAGAALALIGLLGGGVKQASFSWLTAFMFFLSFGLGGLILVILHHLFDASWSVPTRRFCEHLACLLFPTLAILFIPIALNVGFASPENSIYEWITKLREGRPDHALTSKFPLLTISGFFVVVALCFGIWWFLSSGLRKWSLKQDETGDARCTVVMRRYSAFGVFAFAVTLTLAAIMWMKALQHEWFSTMYGVYYFAASIWTTMATVYMIAHILARQGPLRNVVTEKTYYFMGSLMFAFTVFYAYITFFQYFIIWNANVPEETFFYVLRERGAWFAASMFIIFGHFLLPFLVLLRIDNKLKPALMLSIVVWAWFMHFIDMCFQVLPAYDLYKDGIPLTTGKGWIGVIGLIGSMALIGGCMLWAFLKSLNSHPAYPQKDPRIAEAMDVYLPDGGLAKTGGSH